MAERANSRQQGTDGVTLLHEFGPHGDIIHHISFRPDGRQLVTASGDQALKIWDSDTGECLHTLKGHSGGVRCCDWSSTREQVGRIVSGAADNTVRVWNPETGACLKTLTGHQSTVVSTAWSSTAHQLISGSTDGAVHVWSSAHGVEKDDFEPSFQRLEDTYRRGLLAGVISCRFLTDGCHAVSAIETDVRLWAIDDGETVTALGCESVVSSLSVNPRDGRIAASCHDGAVRIWAPIRTNDTEHGSARSTGSSLRYSEPVTLEGHTGPVSTCAFSYDGRLLASKSHDGTIRLWRTDTWQTVAIIREADSEHGWDKLQFHPTQPILATPGENDWAVRLWQLDYGILMGDEPAEAAIHYTTARIALVGDSGVGKTGLGWRIAHGEFKEHRSTHGQQFWVIDELGATREDGTQCEAVLWDFAGQDDYRLVHSLFLGEVDLGLLLFDPGRREKPLSGVEFWVKQFRHNARELLRTILVAARSDRGQPTLTVEELAEFCNSRKISGGYFATSAKNGTGIDELLDCVRRLIPWDRYSSTVTTATFKRVKDFVLKLKEAREPEVNGSAGEENAPDIGAPSPTQRTLSPPRGEGKVLVEPDELRAMLEAEDADWHFTYAEMMTAVRHLASHGYVTVCEQADGDESILLFPDVLIGLASSMVNAARGNPQGLGALIENEIDTHRYRFQELDGLAPEERETLIQSAVRLFLKQHICFRESDTSGSRTFLVFPSLINEKRPRTGQVEPVESTSYHVEGAVETVYPALVVLLGYTDHFSRTNQWQDQAQYEFDTDEICGFRQITEHEGEAELVLYFGTETPPDTEKLFRALFERFLRGRDVNVTRYPPVECQCGELLERTVVMKQISRGRASMSCYECGESVALPAAEEIFQLPKSDDARVDQAQAVANRRTAFQEALTTVRAIVRERGNDASPSCFLSYAWGVAAHEKWVRQLADDLRDAGIHGRLDVKHNTPGTDIDAYIEQILETDFVVVVGTPKLLQKYENQESDNVVSSELKLINTRRMQPNRFGRNTVVPVMLEGDPAMSLPPLLQNTVFVDFTDQQQYFERVFDLVLTLHGIPFDHPGIVAARRSGVGNAGVQTLDS